MTVEHHHPATRLGRPVRRVLVAGIGNVIRGDDRFGPAIVEALGELDGLGEAVDVIELGIGGVHLVHALMEGYDALIIVDAVARGGDPGDVYLLEPSLPEVGALTGLEQRELAGDTHQAVPGSALVMARAAGVLPRLVRIVGCEPQETEHFSLELTPPVRDAVPRAAALVRELLDAWLEPAGEGRPA